MPWYVVQFRLPAPTPPTMIRLPRRADPGPDPGPAFVAGILVQADGDVLARYVAARLLFGSEGYARWLEDGREAPFTAVFEVASPAVTGSRVWPPDDTEDLAE